MQAIITKFLPATNFKPSRIKASCERGSLTKCYHSLECDDMTGEGAHISAARLLCEKFAQEDAVKYGSDVKTNPWLRPLHTGQIPSGEFVHTF